MISALSHLGDVIVVGSAPPGADLSVLRQRVLDVVQRQAEPYRRGLAGQTAVRVRKRLTPVPLLGRAGSLQLIERVDEAIVRWRPDALFLEGMYSCEYRRPGLPAIVDLPDVVSGLCWSAVEAHPVRYAAARWQAGSSERYEHRVLPTMTAVIAINDDDGVRLSNLGVKADVVPLAVTIPSEKEVARASPGQKRDDQGHDPQAFRLLFVGNFLHAPNRDAAAFIERRLVPALERRGMPFRLTIAGRAATPLARASQRRDSVVHAADVPDLGPFYRDADAALLVVRHGGGTKNKTLEAMAWGVPIVGTAQAFTGLQPAAADAYVRVAEDPECLADAIAALATVPQRRQRMGRAGRLYVSTHHTQERVDRAVASTLRAHGLIESHGHSTTGEVNVR
jgi:polysaccharide biosynthesis protein PslH